jgi:ketosteroid isomerase-like protein
MNEGTMPAAELVDRTNCFLNFLEAGDRAGLAEMLDQQVVWSTPMSSDRSEDEQPARGLEAFGARMGSIGALMRSAKFVDRRVTMSADGATTFVQTRGDFVTADGRPYRNVYVFRFDWRDNKIVLWEEYANPITIIRTFPEVYGHLLDELFSQA